MGWTPDVRLAAAVAAFAMATPATAAIRHVAPGGSDDTDCTDASRPCATIQYAIDLANPVGDVIRLAPGTYPENIGLGHWPHPPDLALTIEGAGAELSVIEGDYNTVCSNQPPT